MPRDQASPHAHEFAPAGPHRRRHPARRRRHHLQRLAGTAHSAPHQRRLPHRPTMRSRRPSPGRRVEPTLRAAQDDADADDGRAFRRTEADSTALRPRPTSIADEDSSWSPPVDFVEHEPLRRRCRAAAGARPRARRGTADAGGPQPDRDIECIVILQPAKPLPAGALAAGLHARMGKRLRWFGRTRARFAVAAARIRPRRANSSSSRHACCWPIATARRATRNSTRSSA